MSQLDPDAEGLHPIANTTTNPTADVVFIHGLMGGSHSTWRHGEEEEDGHFFWPEELGKMMPHCAVWSLGYPAAMSHWFGTGMAIQGRARNLTLKLLNGGIGERPLVFIAHSLGGLEVKEIVVRSQTRDSREWQRLVGSIRGIVFCGTPHRGSHFATAAKVLGRYLRTPENVKQMRTGAPMLDTLHGEFVDWQRRTETAVESYVETKKLSRALVVPRESGNPGLAGCNCYPIGADHVTLVKPEGVRADVFVGVQRFIRRVLASSHDKLAYGTDYIGASDDSLPGTDSLLPSPRPAAPSICNLPFGNAAFTGRETYLQRLDRSFMTSRSGADVKYVAVYGLGGVGKSQLARQFADRNGSRYETVWWIAAERPAAIPEELAGLARKLGVHELSDHPKMLAGLWDKLRVARPWLLIYDNAESHDKIAGLCPPSGVGNVIITSRSASWGAATTIELGAFSREESVRFLRRRTHTEDDKSLDAVANELGDLPLALEQAAAYMDENAITPLRYVELFRGQPSDLIALGRPSTTEQTVATVWRVSLGRLQHEGPAQDLLNLCAFLSSDVIPRDLLSLHESGLPDRLREIARQPLSYNATIGTLRRYSLVAATPDSLGMHRLLQQVVRAAMDEQSQRTWAGVAVRLILQAFPENSSSPQNWSLCGQLLPHVLTSVEHAEELGIETESAALLLNAAGAYLWSRFELEHARALHQRAIEIDEAQVGSGDLAVANGLNNLGVVLWDLVDIEGARLAHERALAIRETCLGPDHPAVAASLNNLGVVLWDSADHHAANSLHNRALTILMEQLGDSHPAIVASLTNLGSVLNDLGDQAQAAGAYVRALSILDARTDSEAGLRPAEQVQGAGNDPGELAIARAVLDPLLANNRAARSDEARTSAAKGSGDRSGRTGDASVERARVRAAFRLITLAAADNRPPGEHHPVRAKILDNFGVVLARLGMLEEAKIAFQNALAIREALLGPGHPDLGWSLTNLGVLKSESGQHAAGRGLLEQGLTIREAALGPNHPDVATNLSALGTVLARLLEYDTAKKRCERALAIRTNRLGSKHPATKTTQDNLATVLSMLDVQSTPEPRS